MWELLIGAPLRRYLAVPAWHRINCSGMNNAIDTAVPFDQTLYRRFH